MELIRMQGYQLEKSLPNTSEDYFNRSEITLMKDKKEHTFHVLYLRMFEDSFTKLVPYKKEPLFMMADKELYFKDIVALIFLLKNPEFADRKRLYITDFNEFKQYFKGIRYERIPDICQSLIGRGKFFIRDVNEFYK